MEVSMLFIALLAFTHFLCLNVLEASKHEKDNFPWYPSIDAFEHYDSGRSHLFALAELMAIFMLFMDTV